MWPVEFQRNNLGMACEAYLATALLAAACSGAPAANLFPGRPCGAGCFLDEAAGRSRSRLSFFPLGGCATVGLLQKLLHDIFHHARDDLLDKVGHRQLNLREL